MLYFLLSLKLTFYIHRKVSFATISGKKKNHIFFLWIHFSSFKIIEYYSENYNLLIELLEKSESLRESMEKYTSNVDFTKMFYLIKY